MVDKPPQNSAKSFLIIDAHFLIIVMLLASVALCIFGGAVILHLEKEIREVVEHNNAELLPVIKEMEKQKEKMTSVEDIVFNNYVYPNIKKLEQVPDTPLAPEDEKGGGKGGGKGEE